MKRLIIGFGHKRYSGKDTCAKIAQAYLYKLERSSTRTWFAEALKAAAMEAFDFTEEQVYGGHKGVIDSRWGFTPGWALQRMGTEGFRDVFGFDFWIHRLKMYVDKVDEHVLIADVRFPNEAAAIKSWGGFVVDVVHPQAPEALADGRDSDHPSETALDLYADWDGVILNDGTIEQLRDQVTKLVDRFLRVLAMREREEVS